MVGGRARWEGRLVRRVAAIVLLAGAFVSLPAAEADQTVTGMVAPVAGVGVGVSGAVLIGDGRVQLDVSRVRSGDTVVTTVVSH